MAFVDADAYNAFMGRFSEPLAAELLAFVGARDDTVRRVLDVGCGPGALTQALVERWGAPAVSAVDPSPPFVAAARTRFPAVDVQQAVAESLPFADDAFDLTLAQLVVHFMADPVVGLSEMARVTRPGGTLAACVWDRGGPLAGFWAAVGALFPAAGDESHLAGTREGDLARLAAQAGWREVTSGVVTVTVGFSTFQEWWHPLTLGVGPAGAYIQSLDDANVQRLRDRCEAELAEPPFTIRGSAWAVRGVAG